MSAAPRWDPQSQSQRESPPVPVGEAPIWEAPLGDTVTLGGVTYGYGSR